ncbi:PIN-like domain-containing protein [Rhodococcoides fascians]|uniref:PIN-like domain-containing protein n=1 Tax=Rhodococcoides fascians TaxID=1828 RepID=UPI00068D889B|nr:PIN-like domain-containing protein [Rhodococcus fascians]
MRAQFSEWYELDDDATREMLVAGTIALDANVLLDLYRFGEALRGKVLDVLLDPRVRARLFVPYQAALEYQRNRLDVGHEQSQRFEVLRTELQKLISNFEKKAGGTLRDKDILKSVTEAVTEKGNELAEILTDLEETHVLDYREIRADDGIRNTIDKMLIDADQIGKRPDGEELKKRIEEAQQRFKDGVQTPGLADYKQNKPSPEGDYLIWCELLDHAAAHDRPLLFITGDTKDDWYRSAKGERLGLTCRCPLDSQWLPLRLLRRSHRIPARGEFERAARSCRVSSGGSETGGRS